MLYDYLRAAKAWKAPRTGEFVETTPSNVVPMDVDSLHRKGGEGKKGKGEGKTKVTDPDTTAKVKVYSQSNSDTLTGIAICVVNSDTRNQTVRARTNSSMARVLNVEHMGTRELTVLLKRWHIWNPNL